MLYTIQIVLTLRDNGRSDSESASACLAGADTTPPPGSSELGGAAAVHRLFISWY